MGGRVSSLAVLVAAATTAGCPRPQEETAPRPPKGTVRVRAITDPAPVRLLAPIGNYLFAVGPHGIDRWDPGTEQVLPLSQDHGLPGDRVLAVAPDIERMWLWMATDGGLGYYDVAAETFAEVPSSSLLDVPSAGDALHLAPATDGGVWIGHPKGLYYANPAGMWTSTPISGAISALALGEDGWLWIGTPTGLVGREPSGESFTYGPREGCDVIAVRLIARAPGGGVLVVGENKDGKQRLALRKGELWSSYKVSPDVTIDALAAKGDEVVAKGGRHLYLFSPAGTTKRKKLTRDGVRLLAVRGDKRTQPPITMELLPAQLPVDSMAIASANEQVFVGTRDLGIARWSTDASQPVGWLRRRELLAGATTLTVACRTRVDCWIATGTRRAWHFDGEAFEAAGPEAQAVLAVVRAHDNELYGLHRGGDAASIEISKIGRDGTWTPSGAKLKTPGDRPEVTFARFSPGGVLWVGLRYVDGKDMRPWGVALVDVEVGMVAYHHATTDKKERKQGVMPVPVDVVDASFVTDDEVWMAGPEGAARLTGKQIETWNEASGMTSEVSRAIAVSPGGFVFVATGAGVGAFDGESWSFPRELSFAVNDLAIASDGKLWMATDRGVALYDGRKVKRVDVRRGLLENEIVDVAIDELGRVWARGAESLTVISP